MSWLWSSPIFWYWEKNVFSAGKKCRTEESWPVPPRGGWLWEGGREWELPDRNVSGKRSRNYSQQLWEVTPLTESTKKCQDLHPIPVFAFDWSCFNYFVRNSLVAFLVQDDKDKPLLTLGKPQPKRVPKMHSRVDPARPCAAMRRVHSSSVQDVRSWFSTDTTDMHIDEFQKLMQSITG